MKSKLIKITSLVLFFHVAIFFIIILGQYFDIGYIVNNDSLIRNGVYVTDLEFFFTAIYTVWAIYLWKASKDISKNRLFLRFTGFAFLAHALSMIIVGVIDTSSLSHLVQDSIPWFILGGLIVYKF